MLPVTLAVIIEGEPAPAERAGPLASAAELDEVDWLDPDRPFPQEVRTLLK